MKNFSRQPAFLARRYRNSLICCMTTSNGKQNGPMQCQSTLKSWQHFSSTAQAAFSGCWVTALACLKPASVESSLEWQICTVQAGRQNYHISSEPASTHPQQALQAFSAIAGFPNTIGAIDCTHIPTKTPTENEEAFVNRKGVHTIDVHRQYATLTCVYWTSLQSGMVHGTHDSFI